MGIYRSLSESKANRAIQVTELMALSNFILQITLHKWLESCQDIKAHHTFYIPNNMVMWCARWLHKMITKIKSFAF